MFSCWAGPEIRSIELERMMTALITGANRGIGLALARTFVDREIVVIGGVRDIESATDLRDLQSKHPDELTIIPLDVTDPQSVTQAASTVAERVSYFDMLINNAGVLLEDRDAAFARLNMDDFDRTFAVNVTGVARVIQTFLPMLLKSSRPRIVNISSGAASIGGKADSQYYMYGASKAALNHLTIGLAHELRREKVIVAAISPGWVRTDMGGADADLSPAESAADLAETILRLTIENSGQFLDRKGNAKVYTW